MKLLMAGLIMGRHKILCGDPCSGHDVGRLMTCSSADFAFLDPLSSGKLQFESTRRALPPPDSDIAGVLNRTLNAAVSVSHEGAVHILCIEPRHIAELTATAISIYGEPLDFAVWVKPNAARVVSLYRSELEFFGVFCVGNTTPPAIVRRRSRSNVWHYAAVKSSPEFRSRPKPVALVADVIKDCTRKGAIVLDLFSGAGSTVIAAERVGRHARALESDPQLVDLTVRRWQAFTGKDAVHAERGTTFDQISAESTHAPKQDRK
jgi:DNA methylase